MSGGIYFGWVDDGLVYWLVDDLLVWVVVVWGGWGCEAISRERNARAIAVLQIAGTRA